MKNVKYFIVGTLIMSVINFSCKKDSTPDTTTVEYRVSPMNNIIYELQYRDTTGTVLHITNPSQNPSKFPSNGILVLPASKNLKGFTAFLSIWYNSGPYDFDLKILVNGKVKKDSTIDGNNTINGKISYQLPQVNFDYWYFGKDKSANNPTFIKQFIELEIELFNIH